MKNKIRIYKITLIAMMTTILIVMSVIPNIGFISIPPVSITLHLIPILIFAFTIDDKMVIILSVIFGILSMLLAYIAGVNPADIVFRNPLVSVLPRLIFGIITAFSVFILNKTVLEKKEIKRTTKIITVAISTFILSLVHTVLVLSSFYLSNMVGLIEIQLNMSVVKYIGYVLSFNGLIEASVTALIVTLSYFSIKKSITKTINFISLKYNNIADNDIDNTSSAGGTSE